MQGNFWHKVPIVRVLLPFVGGIGFSMFYMFPFNGILIATILTFVFFVIAFYRLTSYHNRWVHGLLLNLFLFCAGVLVHISRDARRQQDYFANFTNADYVLVRVTEPAVLKIKTIKLKAEAIAVVDSNEQQIPASGKLLVYLKRNDEKPVPAYGDVLLIPIDFIRKVTPPQNPDEFNYKRYLAFNQIYFQAYLMPHQYTVAKEKLTNKLFEWIYATQQYFQQTLKQYIVSPNEVGVAQALIYGYDDDIDNETMQAYANTGTLHVLAVSGMHVGIIYMVLGWLLGFMDKHKKTKRFKLAFILVFLWVYSLLCGFSPSILRATVMFTIIIISEMLERKTNVYNTLAASAFVLLLMDCNMLANVGFQLSYAAVLGIVFVQPYINEWLTPRNWLMNEIWKITSVSIAAQLITMPIGLLYFHQFPNVFLFSNLLIIPLTTGILYAGLVLLAVSPIPLVAEWIGKLMYWTIYFTNELVKWVENLPYAYVNGIHINIAQSILMYVAIVAFIFFFLTHYANLFKLFLFSAICFIVIQHVRFTENRLQQRLLVYNISKQFAAQIFIGNNGVLLIDSALWADKEKIKFHMQQHWWKAGLENQQVIFTKNVMQQVVINDQSIVIGSLQKKETLPEGKHTYLSQKNIPLEKEKIKSVVISSKVKLSKVPYLKAEADSLNIPVYFVGDKGAVELGLK